MKEEAARLYPYRFFDTPPAFFDLAIFFTVAFPNFPNVPFLFILETADCIHRDFAIVFLYFHWSLIHLTLGNLVKILCLRNKSIYLH